MKRIVVTVSVTMIALIVGLWFISRIPNGPKRFANMPTDAVWIGATDEGFWFSVIFVDSIRQIARIQVYNDYNGKLMMDANYKLHDSCKIIPFTKENILKNICYYNHDNIMLKRTGCEIVMIKPAFGGEFWELKKDYKSR